MRIKYLQKKLDRLIRLNIHIYENASGFINGTESKEWKKWNKNKNKIRKLLDKIFYLEHK